MVSKEELEQADELGKSVWIGMELGDTEEGEHLTFYSKSEQEMEDEALHAAKLGATITPLRDWPSITTRLGFTNEPRWLGKSLDLHEVQ